MSSEPGKPDQAGSGANAHACGLATTAARDLAAFDALPPRLREMLSRMPENLAAEAVLQAFMEDGGDEAELMALLERRLQNR